MDLISVIIPAYNVERYLQRCLDSVCGQRYKNLEIILVDDGSTDGTASICDRYAMDDSRIKVVHTDNRGVASARNTALDMVTGDMIAFSDSDDYMEPDMIENMHAAMMEHGADMVSCGYYEEYSDHIDSRGVAPETAVYDRIGAYQDFFMMGGRIGSGLWNKLVLSKVMKDIRFKPYKTGEDVEALCRIIDNCEKVVSTGQAGYHYVHRVTSATRESFGMDNLDILKAADDMVIYICRHHPELNKHVYAFHAAWNSAQIQVLYWNEDTSIFKNEKERIKRSIRTYMPGYRRNAYISRADRLFIYSFMSGCYKPVRRLYDVVFGQKGQKM